ncbi:Hypothetical Protein FCC1311_022532 [Hondaea fermentalgiana]|uniref:Uncharacterized protein n=1 Tax=Hondaea fermentalgiana TaxID=2315210 RepID=A0A2R5GBS8_9STRA|nr:Hypothetical Protein FCC1311_022532 [Hondaea fermentalgiana]|eukprot:GBG26033.1 Hypothetical Protein FCC1311_022532 [Hondaea fermentalgiana]
MLLELRSQNVQSTKLAPKHHMVKVKQIKQAKRSKVKVIQHKHNKNPFNNDAAVPVVLNNEALQSRYLSLPAPSKVLSETSAPSLSQGQPGPGKPSSDSAVDQVDDRVAVMHASYNAIHAEVAEWREKVTVAEAKRKEIKDLASRESEARQTLEDRVAELESGLRNIELENERLVSYVPRMQYMLSRGIEIQKARKATMAGRIDAIRVLEEGREEALSLCKSTKRESASVVQQRDALEASLAATERKYFEALAERRDEIAKVDALTEHFASSIQTIFSRGKLANASSAKEITQQAHDQDGKDTNGQNATNVDRDGDTRKATSTERKTVKWGILGGRHVLNADSSGNLKAPTSTTRRSSRVSSRLATQEMANIASIMSQKGQRGKHALQQLGTSKYDPREIQTIFKSIEERSGVKIITPQEMLDWAHTNRDVENNIREEEAIVQQRIQELAASKHELTGQLALIDQRAGSTNARMKHSAYEDLHREIILAKNRKREVGAQIKERQNMLASFSVCVQGLRDKLASISLAEDWVNKLDSSIHGGVQASSPAKMQRKNRLSSSNMLGDSAVASSFSSGEVFKSAHSTSSVVGCMVSVQEKLGQIMHLCELAAQVGLLAPDGADMRESDQTSVLRRTWLDLNCIEDPKASTNVRVLAGDQEEFTDDVPDVLVRSMKEASTMSKRSLVSMVSAARADESMKSRKSQKSKERRMCAIVSEAGAEDTDFAALRAKIKSGGGKLTPTPEKSQSDRGPDPDGNNDKE